jgi:hypothetical protein
MEYLEPLQGLLPNAIPLVLNMSLTSNFKRLGIALRKWLEVDWQIGIGQQRGTPKERALSADIPTLSTSCQQHMSRVKASRRSIVFCV